MRGMSKLLPDIGRLSPFNFAYGTYEDNVAHSCQLFGFRTYPHGGRPRYPVVNGAVPKILLSNFLIYRCMSG